VSKGPQQVEVPDLVGKTRKEATDILEDAGFKVTPFGAGNFTVKAQNPPPGSKRAKGSNITIVGF
jgi:serine/threonine-protein kinase